MRDDGLLRNPEIQWLSEDDLAGIGLRADAELDAARSTLGWADQTLDDFARKLRERVRRAAK